MVAAWLYRRQCRPVGRLVGTSGGNSATAIGRFAVKFGSDIHGGPLDVLLELSEGCHLCVLPKHLNSFWMDRHVI